MLSLAMIREKPDFVRAALRRRGEEPPIDEVVSLDEQRHIERTVRTEEMGETLRHAVLEHDKILR